MNSLHDDFPQCARAEIVLLPGAFCYDLRGAACQEREQSAACHLAEKSRHGLGARVSFKARRKR
jgi:hypothetical protein